MTRNDKHACVICTGHFLVDYHTGPRRIDIGRRWEAYPAKVVARYFSGLRLGTNLVFCITASRLAAIMLSVPFVRMILLLVSTAYLCWIAHGIAMQGADLTFMKSRSVPSIKTCVALQLVNTIFVSGFSLFPDMLLWELAIKIIIINPVWISLHILCWGMGIMLHKLELPRHIIRRVTSLWPSPCWLLSLSRLVANCTTYKRIRS
ncbi:MAG: hypothetical protein AAF352_02445 [Pseudomonadota bacterium]